MNGNYLLKLVENQKNGIPEALCSVCSSHPFVIESALEKAKADGHPALIEATANQVNQYGGYTGMRPRDFKSFIDGIAAAAGFPADRIIFGGDHLGPLVWCEEPEETAMEKASVLIREFVAAGCRKIHIDTSMRLGSDDEAQPLPVERMAQRAAKLCAAAEAECDRKGIADRPVYVIGSEVPVPGGAVEAETKLAVTEVADVRETICRFKNAFAMQGLDKVWIRVIAVVAQPGVEFDDHSIHEYDRAAAGELCAYMKSVSGMVLEGHSTDYQTKERLRQMAEDGIAILKVGPALTFAMREGIMALERIERELFAGGGNKTLLSDFSRTLDQVMLADPKYWGKYYRGSENEVRLSKMYSFSDRCRYYMGEAPVKEAINRLYSNLGMSGIPLSLISQYLPRQYDNIRSGMLAPKAHEIVKDCIKTVLRTYDCRSDIGNGVLKTSV